MTDLRGTLEAILFTAGEPTRVASLARVLDIPEAETGSLVQELARQYEERGAGLRVLTSPEGVQIVTAPDAALAVEVFVKSGIREKLTPAAAETLAIIAYRGPISRVGVEAIRGVNSSFTLRLLALRGLVVRSPHPTDRRAFVYEVSAEFLRHLGITSIESLPAFAELRIHAGMTKLVEDAEPHHPDLERRGTAGEA